MFTLIFLGLIVAGWLILGFVPWLCWSVATRGNAGLGMLPLAFTGAGGALEDRVAAAHAGASLFLPRPFTSQDFTAAAERMVAARRPERARVLVVDDDPDAITALTHALASDHIEVVGLGDAHGLMEADPMVVQSELGLIGQADELIVLADSSKFSGRSSLILCGLDRITAVISDSGIRDEDRQMLETAGVRLIVAETTALGDRQATVA